MVEGVSLAAMTETPVVIALACGGTATGFPTRTEQGELHMALHAGHGEFPRFIFAPGTPEQAFFLTNKAFDLAEKYQVQAFMSLRHLPCRHAVDPPGVRPGQASEHRLPRPGEAFQKLASYKRHAFTESGVSPWRCLATRSTWW